MKIFLNLVLLLTFVINQKIWADEWQRVYLASFPRSGNHWVRYLIEEATNITTSSAYPDGWEGVLPKKVKHSLLPSSWGGFCCKNGYEKCRIKPSKVDIIIIKTHYPFFPKTPFDLKNCIRTIRIVRHPIDSIYSWYLFVGNEANSKIPKELLIKYVTGWKKFQEYWNGEPNVDTYLYEDLLDNPYNVFYSIMNSTGYQFSDEDIKRAVDRYPPECGKLKNLDKYDAEDLEYINKELGPLLQQFGYN